MRTRNAVFILMVVAACGSSGGGADAGPSTDVVTPSTDGAGDGAGGAVSSGGAGGSSSAGGAGGESVDGAVAGQGGNAADGGGGASFHADAATEVPIGDAGRAPSYEACMYIGGIDRAMVGTFDHQTGRCVAILLTSPGRSPDAGGLSVSDGWEVASIMLWPVTQAGCAQLTRPPGAALAASATGTVTVHDSARAIDVDARLTFPATDAGVATTVEMKAQDVPVTMNCIL